MAAAGGARFIFWDLQHTGWPLEKIAAGMANTRGLDIVPGVRVPAPEPWLIGAALDLGAKLIMVPAVDDAETARAIVDAARYPLAGHRAVTFNFVADRYTPPQDAAAALQAANDEVVVFVQIETAEGLANVDDIATVDGIDVLWVGDNDLAASLGVPGDFDNPIYLDALERVAQAAAKAGKYAGFTTASDVVAAEMLDRGYHILAFGNDIKIFQAAVASGITGFTRALETRIAAATDTNTTNGRTPINA
ncbi:HpcH/HpaI aldolase family protein [Specibacter cremeus]|uniref:HpcH/HpaI aldolase family protein n=1 Tax=Specibacter cremeus TaxID=1629051 RepID=UPI00197BE2BE|nr:aldolase/citrate lyase family protein [Specibacter cremeus]